MSGFAGCGGGNQIGDVVGDVPDEDRIVELDVTYDEGQPDEGRDIGRDEGEPGDSVDDRFVDDSDVNGDIDDIDGGDESGADTPETDGCPGETCEPCPDDGLFCTEEYRDSLGECQVRVKPDQVDAGHEAERGQDENGRMAPALRCTGHAHVGWRCETLTVRGRAPPTTAYGRRTFRALHAAARMRPSGAR